eukprot:14780396-Ditylum_brightwellii.AAC.1
MPDMLVDSTIGMLFEATTTACMEPATQARSDSESSPVAQGVIGSARISPMHCKSSFCPSHDMSLCTSLSAMYLSCSKRMPNASPSIEDGSSP